jgi:hypothetical protein
MELTFKNICGFEFVKIGKFYLNESPLPVRYDGEDDHVNVSLRLIDDLFKKADESAYVIFSDNTLVYVGEFSYNFQDRWLRKDNYVWHNTDTKIEVELKSGNEVCIWLAVDPFALLANGSKINISKSIEQEILKSNLVFPDWNKRGQFNKWAKWREKNCLRVTEIINQLNNDRGNPRGVCP